MMSSDDRREIIQLISEWNSSRYDLFALSQPNENLEFHGVMRFYFQDVGEKVATKCIRVESTASTDDVIKVLIEKFRPDMKSLSAPKDYAIYETHADGVERKLAASERPLWIQLEWAKDGREGRFLLKNENAKSVKFDTSSNEAFSTGPATTATSGSGGGGVAGSYKRRFSRKDKKEQQKDQKQAMGNKKPSRKNVAENLYKEVPDSKFTRSISNPEAVMARRRQQKLENKLRQIQLNDGGGTLKVYGETLKPDIPYKTLLMSNKDTAVYAVREILEKYGMSNEDVDDYCLVQVITPTREERELNGTQIKEIILDDNESPLNVLMHTPCVRGTIIFQIRKCAPQMVASRKARRKLEAHRRVHESMSSAGGAASEANGSCDYGELGATPANSLNSTGQTTSGFSSYLNRSHTLPHKHGSALRQLHARSANLSVEPAGGGSGGEIYEHVERRRHLSRTESLNRTYLSRRHSELQNYLMMNTRLPCLVELAQDGYDLQTPAVHQIKSDFYEIGNDKLLATTHPNNYIRLNSTTPGIEKKHCALKKSADNLQLLLVPYAETYVNEVLVKEPTQLFNNNTVRLGKYALYRVENPNENSNLIVANNSSLNPLAQLHQQHYSSSGVAVAPQQPPANYGLLYESGLAFDSLLTGHNYMNASVSKLSLASIPQGTVQPAAKFQSTITAASSMAASYSSSVGFSPLASLSMNNLSRPAEGLPGLLEFPDDREDALLAHICHVNPATFGTQFKLAPAYSMYMMLRYRLSHKYKNEQLTFAEKLAPTSALTARMASFVREAVSRVEPGDKQVMVYWLANASEFLSFLKQDVHLAPISADAQSLLAESVHAVYESFVSTVQRQLDQVLPAFYDNSDDDAKIYENCSSSSSSAASQQEQQPATSRPPTLHSVLAVLDEAMNLLRGSRVNAAFTIQFYSQIFHYMSSWLFNTLTADSLNMMGYCSMFWGGKLFRRVNRVHAWSEKHGLELAANNHLSRIIQAAFFLKSPKHDTSNLSMISSNCFGLNSVQIAYLVEHYYLDLNEQLLSQQLCSKLVAIAKNTADELLKQEGRPVRLHEDLDLHAGFIFPESGHSSDVIKGLPMGLVNFIMNFQNAGLCWLWQNTQSSGNWKRFFSATICKELADTAAESEQVGLSKPGSRTSEQVVAATSMILISLTKINGSLGFSIVAGKPSNSADYGIYIKSIVPGGAASFDGRLEVGDQILTVNGFSLVNVSQIKAAEYLTNCGQVATLQVAKHAAFLNGLDSLLLSACQMSPSTARFAADEPAATLMSPQTSKNKFGLITKRFSELNHSASRYLSLPRNYSVHGPPTYENAMYNKVMSPQQQQQQQQQKQHYLSQGSNVNRPVSAAGFLLSNKMMSREQEANVTSSLDNSAATIMSMSLENATGTSLASSPKSSAVSNQVAYSGSADWSAGALKERPLAGAVSADLAVNQINRNFSFLSSGLGRSERGVSKGMVNKQESICELEEIDATAGQDEPSRPPESQKHNSPVSACSVASSALDDDSSSNGGKSSERESDQSPKEADSTGPSASSASPPVIKELSVSNSPKGSALQLPHIKLAQQESDDLDTMVVAASDRPEFNLGDSSSPDCSSTSSQSGMSSAANSSDQKSAQLTNRDHSEVTSSSKFSPTSSTKSGSSADGSSSLQSIMVSQNRTVTSPGGQVKSPQSQKRVMFNETTELVEFERADSIIDIDEDAEDEHEREHDEGDEEEEEEEEEDDDDQTSNCSLDSPLLDDISPSVIGKNEVYIDHYLNSRKQSAESASSVVVEGEKLSFKDKIKLFTKQSNDLAKDLIKKRTT